MTRLSASEIMEKLSEGYSLPALSVVALKMVELASDETCSAKGLAELIEKDPALTVRMLQMANSAFFHTGRPVSTLEQAVVKVGFHRLRIMALSLSLRDTFPMGRKGPLDYERFWRTSLYRALMARSLAEHLGDCNPEEAFVAGLILEIGVLIFFDLFPGETTGDAAADGDDLEVQLARERETFGLDHRQVGEAALRFWRFPPDILACQRRYGDSARSPEAPPLAGICDAARNFSSILFQRSKDFSSLFTEAHRSLGLAPEVINDMLLSTFEKVQGIAESFRLELNQEKDLIRVMEKANQALGRLFERMTMPHPDGDKKTLPTFESLSDAGEAAAHALQAVAHEIRNPLMAVGGFAGRLAASLDPDSDGCEYARVILKEARRLEEALKAIDRRSKDG